ncbi:MAG: radical SAM protein [Theionarchaea archaeon]|nr:radical SAM protein [Theionarchaea archaeon]
MFSAPNHVNFLLTHHCNLNCRYCYAPLQPCKEASTEQVLAIIDILYKRGVFSLDLTGGEPLLRDDISKILQYCNDLDIDVGLATNGTSGRKKIESLARSWDKKKTVHVSVDASTPEKYYEITGSRDFHAVLDCTRALLEYDLDVIWNFVYTPLNKDNLESVCDLAINLGVTKMFVIPVIEVGRAKYQVTFQDMQAFLVHFPVIQEKYPSIRMRVTPAAPLDFLVPLLEAGWSMQKIGESYPYARTPLQDEKFREMRNTGCIGGVGRWAVNAQGDVFPCELLVSENSMKSGNLLKDSFEECLLACNSLLDVRVEEIGRCINCRYADICGGGCRARAFAKYGSVSAPDPLCPLYGSGFSEKKRSIEPRKKVQKGWKAFSVEIHGYLVRVRKEAFGGTVYIPGREQQIYVNEDGYTIFEILQRTQERIEITSELERMGLSLDKKSIAIFLNQLEEIIDQKNDRSSHKMVKTLSLTFEKFYEQSFKSLEIISAGLYNRLY